MNNRIERKIERICDGLRESLDETTNAILLLKRTVKTLPSKDRKEMVKRYNDILTVMAEFANKNLLDQIESDFRCYII